MSAIRRFMALEDENSIFKFTIDTTKIVSGATNGSQNPLTFRLPITQNATNAFVIKVSDGRPDVIVTSATTVSAFTLTFPTAGIYTITLIGKVGLFNFNNATYGFDKLKIISIDNWGNAINWGNAGAFIGCSNLDIKAENVLNLPSSSTDFFNGIKQFTSPLSRIETSKCTTAIRIVANITTPLNGTLNPFWKSLTSVAGIYSGNTFDSSVDKIEIISDTVTSLSTPWDDVVFQKTGPIELICNTPNLVTMFRVFRNGEVFSRCHAGKIDVRKVTTTSNWLSAPFSTSQTDETLLGWANNFDWTGITSTANFDFVNSVYTKSAAVIAARDFLISKGMTFTRLL